METRALETGRREPVRPSPAPVFRDDLASLGYVALNWLDTYKKCINVNNLRTVDGRELPPMLKAEIRRELDRLALATAQLAAVERAR